jgi:hypothetical protein
VILSGDPGQIPPVQGTCLWDSSSKKGDDPNGFNTYNYMFQRCIILTEVKRIEDDPEAATFLKILDNLRNGENTEDEWRTVCRTCLMDSMGHREWEARFGGNQDVTYLFTTNKEVTKYNHSRLKELDTPITLIQAKHSRSEAKRMSSDSFRGLQTCLYLAVGAKVYLTSNIGTSVGLCNGTVGYVMDIIYKDDVDRDDKNNPIPSSSPPDLPKYVWVDFGNSYRGPSFFDESNVDRRGWVPVYPITSSVFKRGTQKIGGEATTHEYSRTMLPLRLAWAWTFWKAQGQTFRNKIIMNLSNKEKENGLTYTGFSRATKLSNIGIIGGLSLERFTVKIRNHRKMKPRRKEEERQISLSNQTVKEIIELREKGVITVRYTDYN